MFSMSMMASSTTTPSAITRPASTIVLIVAPRSVEHQPRRDQRQRDGDQADERRPPLEQERDRARAPRAAQPRSSASVRLWMAISMKVGGPEDRRVDRRRPGRPGRSSSSAVLDAACDSSVLRPRQLLDDEQQARAVVDDRVADRRLVARRPRRPRRPARSACPPRARDRHLGEVARRRRSAACARTASRWLGVSTNPPVPITRALGELQQPGVERVRR